MAKLRQFQVAGTAGVEEEDMEAETRLMEERMHARAKRSAENSQADKPVTIKVGVVARRWMWPWGAVVKGFACARL
eukprot:1159954-Pelagomonas_calceolata.AAC.14